MENEKRLLFLASEVTIAEEEDKLNPVFLSITLKLADNLGNRNNEGITAEFISDLINRQKEFECLPFYADVDNLLARNYDKLSHKFNRITKRFSTTQIGSCTDFYSEVNNEGVVSLYATARVPKREKEICLRLAELYEMGQLWVSFEIRYNPEHTIQKDGIYFIDAHEDNALTGIALVSVPAVADAGALDMVAEVVDNSEDFVAGCEEQAERGETKPMNKETITAETTEEIEPIETVAETEEQPIAVAEGEGASDGGEGASDGGEGASDGGGSGASGDDDSGDDAESTADVEPVIDPSEQKRVVAEETQAEVLEHSVDTHESVEVCPYSGEPVHVIEYHERIIETLEDAGALIAELDKQIAELNEIKAKYDTIIAEQEAKVLAEKRESLRAFAEKQGLDIKDTAVAEAIEKLDYEKVTELSMAEEKDPEAEEKPAKQTITLASFVEMEVSDDKYGGLLNRKNK